jgi:hypothetical protein
MPAGAIAQERRSMWAFRGAVDNVALGRTLRPPEGQFVAFAQTVGHPA